MVEVVHWVGWGVVHSAHWVMVRNSVVDEVEWMVVVTSSSGVPATEVSLTGQT